MAFLRECSVILKEVTLDEILKEGVEVEWEVFSTQKLMSIFLQIEERKKKLGTDVNCL